MNKRAIIVLLLLLCFGAAVKAATDGQDSQAASRHGKPTAAAKDSDTQSDDTVEKFKPKSAETPGGEENLAPDVVRAKNDYDREYWQYRSKSLVQTERTFAWQHTSSIVIFYVVVFLVLVGVLFAWLQFRAAAFKSESQELDASMKGVKITSSTLGVVILVLSMCFFYLYLRYVYPITPVETPHTTAAGAQSRTGH